MATASKCIKVLVLPVYKRTWLYHAWLDEAASELVSPGKLLNWREGKTLQDKLSIAWGNVGHRLDASIRTQWKELQAAKGSGSLRSYLYRFAQFVLSREDPVESFLKSVPADAATVQLIYPSSLKEAMVRRRMRLLARAHCAQHRRMTLTWGLATVPQLPLLLTPLPNVTVYYSVYRYLSNLQAMHGAKSLKSALKRSDALQLERMYRLFHEADAGEVDRPRLNRLLYWRNKRSQESLARGQEKYQRIVEKDAASGRAPLLSFEPSPALDEITSPSERLQSPLSDAAVQHLSQMFKLDGLMDHYARARKQATAGAGSGWTGWLLQTQMWQRLMGRTART